MKTPIRILLFIILLGGIFLNAFSQADSTTICFSQENADSSAEFSKHLKYSYMDDQNLNLKDESWLFKIGLPPIGITSYKNGDKYIYENIGITLAVEKKIYTPLSIIIQSNNTYNKSGDSTFFNLGIDYGIRYYFLMKDRIRRGLSGNNCNGVYLDFFIQNLNKYDFQKYNISYENYYDSDFKYHNYSYILNKAPSLCFSIGLQKRLNNFSYIDIKLYVQYKPDDYYKRYVLKEYPGYDFRAEKEEFTVPSYTKVGIDFRIGLAWGLQ